MRFYRVSFVAGFAAGFVAGSRAGRGTYDQLVKLAKATAEHPAVQQAAGTVQSQAASMASTATSKVGDKMPSAAQNVARTVSDRLSAQKNGGTSANAGAADLGSVTPTNGYGAAGPQ